MVACPDCGGKSCEDHFHQMLFWEAEFPELGVVHHYLVLCYHLQHPRLYSAETLPTAKQMLGEFLAGATPQQMRVKLHQQADSGKRTHTITGTPASFGRYQNPVQWTLTAQDVVTAGTEAYLVMVERWAQSIYRALQTSSNL